jgi:selenide,water dikinase
LRHLLTDAQTLGGLLISCAEDAAEELVASIKEAGYPMASIIGAVAPGAAGVEVEEI